MISVRLDGLDKAIEEIRSVPDSIGIEAGMRAASEEFASVLAGATPPGWSGTLPEYVLADNLLAGYDSLVETSGNPALNTSGARLSRRLRRWVSVEELDTVLQDTVSRYTADFAGSVLEKFAVEASRGLA